MKTSSNTEVYVLSILSITLEQTEIREANRTDAKFSDGSYCSCSPVSFLWVHVGMLPVAANTL